MNGLAALGSWGAGERGCWTEAKWIEQWMIDIELSEEKVLLAKELMMKVRAKHCEQALTNKNSQMQCP